MGGSNSTPDYRPEIDQGLAQANQPKSELAQQLSSYFSSLLPPSPGQTSQGQNPQAPPQQRPISLVPTLGPLGASSGPKTDLIPGSSNNNLVPYNPTPTPLSVDQSFPQYSPQSSGQQNNPFAQLLQHLTAITNAGNNDPRLNGSVPGLDQSIIAPTNAQNPGVAPTLAQLLSGAGQNVTGVNYQGQSLAPYNAPGGDLQSANANDPYSQAVQQILANKQNQDVADLRARFGAEGGSSRGTPAQYAEAQLRSQQVPEIAAALGQIHQQDFANNLAGRGQDIGMLNNNNNNSLSAALANLQAGLTGRGQNNDLISSLLGANNTLAGINTNAAVQSNDQNLQRLLGMNSQQSQNAQFNASQTNQLNQNAQNLNNTNLQQIAAFIQQLAGMGIPGGSANVNVGPISGGQGNTTGSTLAGLGQLAEGASSIYNTVRK